MTGITGNGALRAAIIGCGAIAYDHLPFLSTSPMAELVGLCDRSRALAQAARDRFGSGEVHTDAKAMLDALRPDIVHVLTPPHTHDEIVRLALAAGAHVICEKPMTGTAAETQTLLGLARQAGRVLVESRNLLFNDAVIGLKELISAGRLGTVRECDVILSLDFLSGPLGDQNLSGPAVDLAAGSVHDFLPHLVYLFQALSGAFAADNVRGQLINRSGNRRAGYDFLDVLIDAGAVRGRLRIATDVGPPAFRVFVRGTAASAEVDLYNPYLRLEGPPDIGKRAPLGQIRQGLAMMRSGFANFSNKVRGHGTTHGLPRMLDAVYSAIATSSPLPIHPDAIMATARLTDQIVALREIS